MLVLGEALAGAAWSLCSSHPWLEHCSGSLVLCLPCPAKLGRVCGFDFPWTSQGVQKRPLLVYTDRSPRAWATHKHKALLGQAQNGARARVAETYS